MSKYVAAIDQGTTSTRFIVFDHEGKIVGSSQKEHKQIYPKSGWVEHDPFEILKNTKEVIQLCLSKFDINKKDILAVGITNQRETTIVWEKKTGEPITNAIVWQDTRTDLICNHLSNEIGEENFQKKTGLPLSTYFSGPKIKWVLENIDGAKRKAENGELLFGNIDSWLIWNLTGGKEGGIHITDVTNASRTLLMDLSTLDWDFDLIKQLDIPPQMLPKITASSNFYGYIKGFGLNGIPISGDLGDQQAALFGQTCFSVGEVKNTYGTGCFMLLNTGTDIVHSKNGLLTTVGYKIGNNKPVYALEGSIAITGALVQWLRDNLKIIKKTKDIETLANSVKDSGGIFFVPAFSGLFVFWHISACDNVNARP